MLRISKLADYGTAIMNYLANHTNSVFSASEIADRTHIALPTVSKILKILLEAKLVVSIRGTHGGYKIAKSAQEISIAQIITAIDGKPALTECAQANSTCLQDSVCNVKHNWQIINRFVMATLENLTLADMAKPLNLIPQLNTIKQLKSSTSVEN